VSAAAGPERDGSRVLFVTSNGTGLGHLTRAMAIARRLGERPVSILTLSAAAPVAAEHGFQVEYFPAHDAAAAGSPRRWDRRLRARLELLLDELRPGVLVFDGAHPYDALVAVLRGARRGGLAAVWCRRAMWQPGFGAEGIYWSDCFDLIIEPGELAEAEDRGLTAPRRGQVAGVGPIVYLEPEELAPRERAVRELGLEPGRVNALVQLGQGPSVDEALARSLQRLVADPEVQVAALESSLSGTIELPDGVVHLRSTYPMSRYYRAFDLAVSASGYNAFHELIAHRVPSLFVPMPRRLDDQAARARWARGTGVGEGVEGPLDPSLEERLGRLLDPREREQVRARIDALALRNGAGEAAHLIEELAATDGSAAGPHIKPNRRICLSHGVRSSRLGAFAVSAQLVRRVGLRLPAVIARRELDRFRNPPPPPAKLVCVALGLEGSDLIASLQRVSARNRIPPRRVLAVTDSLDFSVLRRAGFAFEYIPSEGRATRVLQATGERYEEFLRRRLAALRAERRGARVIELARG
jgi:UDP:flavonoid glycosyltransferase YjiC (YdhE family)